MFPVPLQLWPVSLEIEGRGSRSGIPRMDAWISSNALWLISADLGDCLSEGYQRRTSSYAERQHTRVL